LRASAQGQGEREHGGYAKRSEHDRNMGVSASLPKSCLPPVVSPEVRLLICGSLPGEASLLAERYYAHPQNQFWRLLGGVVGEPLAGMDYEERLGALLDRSIGLWDVVASARRTGSLDGAMREIEANPLSQLVDTLPRLEAVAFNGGTAAKIGRRALAGTKLALIDLPSSSPAYTLKFADKAARWDALRPWVD
jgi:hypoxanthine-DNA glycosylase